MIIKTPDCTCPVGWEHILAPEGGPQRPPVSVSLECSRVHWFLYRLWLLCDTIGELKSCDGDDVTCRAENTYTPALYRGFADPCPKRSLPGRLACSQDSAGCMASSITGSPPPPVWGPLQSFGGGSLTVSCLISLLLIHTFVLLPLLLSLGEPWAGQVDVRKHPVHIHWHINRPAGSGAGWPGKATALICDSPWPFEDNLETNLGHVIAVTHASMTL